MAAALLLLAGCAGGQPAAEALAPPSGPVATAFCAGFGLEVRTGFHQAGMAGCAVDAPGRATLAIAPETRPINASPWYAFAVRAARASAPLVELRYAEAGHRYHPWVETPGRGWVRLPPAAVAASADGLSARVQLPPGRSWRVAAQPIEAPSAALGPWEDRAAAGLMTAESAGRSRDGEPIRLYLHRPARAQGLVLLVGRQHPPEIPGAWAFDAFTRELFGPGPEAARLRARVAIAVVPLLNPDGIRRGHWRGNAAGADLNRDWGRFLEPETAAVGRRFETLAAELPLLAAIDFHATRRDVIYAPPAGAARQGAGDRMLELLARDPAGRAIPVSRRHEVGAPTFKAWTLDRFGVAGLTWEAGDNTPAEVVAANAKAGARALVAALQHILGEEQP